MLNNVKYYNQKLFKEKKKYHILHAYYGTKKLGSKSAALFCGVGWKGGWARLKVN